MDVASEIQLRFQSRPRNLVVVSFLALLRRPRRLVAMFGITIVLGLLLSASAGASLIRALFYVIFCLLFLIPLVSYVRIRINPKLCDLRTMTFGQTGVLVESEGFRAQIAWAGFSRKIESFAGRGFILFKKGSSTYYWIPANAFDSDAQMLEWVHFVSSQLEVA